MLGGGLSNLTHLYSDFASRDGRRASLRIDPPSTSVHRSGATPVACEARRICGRRMDSWQATCCDDRLVLLVTLAGRQHFQRFQLTAQSEVTEIDDQLAGYAVVIEQRRVLEIGCRVLLALALLEEGNVDRPNGHSVEGLGHGRIEQRPQLRRSLCLADHGRRYIKLLPVLRAIVDVSLQQGLAGARRLDEGNAVLNGEECSFVV